MSQRTKHVIRVSIIMRVLSIILDLGPIAVYAVLAFQNHSTPANKCVLLSMLSVGVVLAIGTILVNITRKVKTKAPRCGLWLVVIGLYLCLDSIIGCILVIAVTQVINELIVLPIARHYEKKIHINREIDRRGV